MQLAAAADVGQVGTVLHLKSDAAYLQPSMDANLVDPVPGHLSGKWIIRSVFTNLEMRGFYFQGPHEQKSYFIPVAPLWN